MSSFRRRHDPHTHLTWASCWRKCSRLISKATDKLLREVHFIIIIFGHVFRIPVSGIYFSVCMAGAQVRTPTVFSILSTTYFHVIAPDVAALALSGDWAAEFLSGPDSASTPGLTSLGDAADADWTREFIAEAAGSSSLL